jgi:hypothetical protein
VSSDPFAGRVFEPASLQRYVYALNNPVNRLDPSGRTSVLDVEFAVAEEDIVAEAAVDTAEMAVVELEVALTDALVEETAAEVVVENAAIAAEGGELTAAVAESDEAMTVLAKTWAEAGGLRPPWHRRGPARSSRQLRKLCIRC